MTRLPVPSNRRTEAGLTLLETLIAIAIAAIIGASLMNLGARNADGNVRRATRALDADALSGVERVVRNSAARAVAMEEGGDPLIEANPVRFAFASVGQVCGAGRQVVTYAVEARQRGVSLVERCGRQARDLFGDAKISEVGLSYSRDGVTWFETLDGADLRERADRAPVLAASTFVRVDIAVGDGRKHGFVVRLGGADV